MTKLLLEETHKQAGATLVNFFDWQMPIHYGSQLSEHHAVRKAWGIFDVSHMTIIDCKGTGVQAYLRHLMANDIAKLKMPGKALYSCMLNEDGGILDDLLIYYLDENNYRIVVNCATRKKDLAWLEQHASGFDIRLQEQTELVMLAIQGPEAREQVLPLLVAAGHTNAQALKPFACEMTGEWLIARTGYTGEDGFEVMLPPDAARKLWDDCIALGVTPCGLGARDTLRLEAGLNLYGQDMDETVTPLESNLTWTVSLTDPDRDFIGREALIQQTEAGLQQQLTGLVLQTKGVCRAGQKVIIEGIGEGITTSGTFSPTCEVGIAFARLPYNCGDKALVEIRKKTLDANIVKLPFVKGGKQNF